MWCRFADDKEMVLEPEKLKEVRYYKEMR